MAVLALALAIPEVIFRGRPSLRADTGIFLSVGARILEGDQLYAGVYDNKDPLFLYAYAGAMWIGGWRAPFLLDIVWVTIAGASIGLFLRRLTGSSEIAICGLLVYPLFLTSYWYVAGHSQLAALSLAPLAALLWLAGRPFSAGVIVGVALLFKLVLTPVVLAPIVVLAALRLPSGSPRRRAPLRLVGGLGASLGTAVLVLGARGELAPYLHVLWENVQYSEEVLAVRGGQTGILGHVKVVRDAVLHPVPFVLLNAVGSLLALLVLTRRARWPRSTTVSRPLAWMYLAVMGATAATLALTAAWSQHIQMLAFPAALFACFLFSITPAPHTSRVRVGVGAGVIAVVVVALGALAVRPSAREIPIKTWWSSPAQRSPVAEALEDVRTTELRGGDGIGYAVLGGNDERAHAAFISDSFELECPRFHQYVFSPYLDEVVTCLRDKNPTLIVMTPEFHFRSGSTPAWRAFTADASAVVNRGYERVRSEMQFDVWVRRS